MRRARLPLLAFSGCGPGVAAESVRAVHSTRSPFCRPGHFLGASTARAPSSTSSLRTAKRSSAALSSHTGVSLTARPLLCPGVRGFASPSEEPKKEPSRWEKIKATFREHGPVFVGFYAVTWLGGFGVCWTGVTIAGVDGVALLQYLGADNVFDTSALSPTLVNALIAAEINELGEFVRLPLVIATTPALSRRLKALRR